MNCKSKTRTILVSGKLKKLLLNYAKRKHITAGAIFAGKSGKSLDRSSINTTRIYIMTTGVEHRRKIERLGLVI